MCRSSGNKFESFAEKADAGMSLHVSRRQLAVCDVTRILAKTS